MSDAASEGEKRNEAAAKPARTSRHRRIGFIVATNLFLLCVIFGAAELGLRWVREGSLGRAFESLYVERPVPANLSVDK